MPLRENWLRLQHRTKSNALYGTDSRWAGNQHEQVGRLLTVISTSEPTPTNIQA